MHNFIKQDPLPPPPPPPPNLKRRAPPPPPPPGTAKVRSSLTFLLNDLLYTVYLVFKNNICCVSMS